MTATIIKLKAVAVRKRTIPLPARPPMPAQAAAEEALRLLKMAVDDLTGERSRGAKQALVIVGVAVDILERGVRSGVEDARETLKIALLVALGPGVKHGEVVGAAKMITLMSDLLPSYADLPPPA